MSRHALPYSLYDDHDDLTRGEGRHRAPQTLLAYVEERADGMCRGEVVLGSGDDADVVTFDVEDNEPDDVWGPILSRIAEEVGYNGSPDHCDGGEVTGHHIHVEVGLFEISVDGTPS